MANQRHNDGGRAFPLPGYTDGSGVVHNYPEFGMTLRDWFAGQALAGMLASDTNTTLSASMAAAESHRVADAMLAASAKSAGQPQAERERDEALHQRDASLAALRSAQTMLEGALAQRDAAQADCIDAADVCRVLMSEVQQLRMLLGMNPAHLYGPTHLISRIRDAKAARDA